MSSIYEAKLRDLIYTTVLNASVTDLSILLPRFATKQYAHLKFLKSTTNIPSIAKFLAMILHRLLDIYILKNKHSLPCIYFIAYTHSIVYYPQLTFYCVYAILGEL